MVVRGTSGEAKGTEKGQVSNRTPGTAKKKPSDGTSLT